VSRRVSSRDDLFLSAVDLYTVLALAFIGFAHVARSSGGALATADLPLAREGDGSTRKSQVAEASWVDPPARDARPGATCTLQIASPRGTNTFRESCVPPAFHQEVKVSRALKKLAASLKHKGEAEPRVVVRCPPAQGLYACAALQWLLHDAGFSTVAAVRRAEAGR
jgi:hypothetical protein